MKKAEKEDVRKDAVRGKVAEKVADKMNLNRTDLMDIQRDEAFKLLFIRNLIFHNRFKPPEVYEECQFLIDFVQTNFRQIKFNLNVLVKVQDISLAKERERTTLNEIFRAMVEETPEPKMPVLPSGQTRADWLTEKVAKFREIADISNSLLNLYINVVCRNKSSLTFLERENVLGVTFVLLRKIVFAEGTFAVDFISELVKAFFFEKVEEMDPFDLVDPETQPTLTIRNLYVYNPNPITLTQLRYQEQLLKLIFDSVIEFNRLTKEELLINPEQRREFKAKSYAMVELLVNKLHE